MSKPQNLLPPHFAMVLIHHVTHTPVERRLKWKIEFQISLRRHVIFNHYSILVTGTLCVHNEILKHIIELVRSWQDTTVNWIHVKDTLISREAPNFSISYITKISTTQGRHERLTLFVVKNRNLLMKKPNNSAWMKMYARQWYVRSSRILVSPYNSVVYYTKLVNSVSCYLSPEKFVFSFSKRFGILPGKKSYYLCVVGCCSLVSVFITMIRAAFQLRNYS